MYPSFCAVLIFEWISTSTGTAWCLRGCGTSRTWSRIIFTTWDVWKAITLFYYSIFGKSRTTVCIQGKYVFVGVKFIHKWFNCISITALILLNFWGHQFYLRVHWLSKSECIASMACFVAWGRWILQMHLWCGGQHGWATLNHLLFQASDLGWVCGRQAL